MHLGEIVGRLLPVRLRGAVCGAGGAFPLARTAVCGPGSALVAAPAQGPVRRRHARAGHLLRHDAHRSRLEPLHEGHGLGGPAAAAQHPSGAARAGLPRAAKRLLSLSARCCVCEAEQSYVRAMSFRRVHVRTLGVAITAVGSTMCRPIDCIDCTVVLVCKKSRLARCDLKPVR